MGGGSGRDGSGAVSARLDSLTGLRFVAALLVFGNHVGDVALTGRDDGGATWLSVGRVGVSFFFILSGFVLAWSGAAAVGLGTFYRRRIARIVPIHVVTWLFAIVVLMASGDVLGWTGGVLSLSLLQAWASDPSVHFAANSVSWSLSCELFFYASFPFIVMLFERMRSAGRHTAIGALVVATVVVPFVAAATLPEATAGWAVYVLPLTRLTEFALGVLLALQLRAGRLPRIRAVHACVAVAVAYALATIVPPVYRPAAVTLVPFALLIVGAAQQDLLGRRSWMSSHWLVRLGEWSFAFYLVHRAALTIVDEVIGFSGRPMPVVAVLVAASLGLGVAFAYTLHTSVERPAERLLRGPSRGGVQWTPWRAWIPWSVGPKALTGAMVTAAIIVSAVVVGLTPPSHHVAAAPYLIPLADGVEIVPLVTVGDAAILDDGYRFVGGGEGLGAADGGSDVIVYADHDLRADQGSTRRHGQSGAFVSRLVMDRDTLAITSGSDLIDPGVEFWDYPSGALVTREPRFADGTPQDIRFSKFNSGQLTTLGQLHNPRSGRGYEGRLFFANEENGDSARVFGITEDGQATMLPRLGLFSRENTAVATNRDDTTMIIGNEDASSGQLWVYVGAKQNHGGAVDRAGVDQR